MKENYYFRWFKLLPTSAPSDDGAYLFIYLFIRNQQPTKNRPIKKETVVQQKIGH
jgi:hypothetical protein